MAEEARTNIVQIVQKLENPAYFVMGKYDYMTSARAAKEYFDALEAPVKEFVLFKQSAHYPQFEEKDLFSTWLNTTWKQLSANNHLNNP